MAFKLMNTEVHIDPFFIAIIILAIISDLSKPIMALLLALGVHEFAHILAARGLGYTIDKVKILPFGGIIDIREFDDMISDLKLVVILAGPIANFITTIFLIFLISRGFLSLDFCRVFINRQLYLGFFNLLPALPLDGGRIFVLWLRQKVTFISAVRIVAITGKVLAVGLFAIGTVGFLFKRFFIDFLILGVFLFLEAVKAEKEAPITFVKYTTKKKGNLLKQGYLPMEAIVVIDKTPVKDIMYLFMPQKYYLVYVLNNKMKVSNCLTETEIFSKIIEKGLDSKIEDLI